MHVMYKLYILIHVHMEDWLTFTVLLNLHSFYKMTIQEELNKLSIFNVSWFIQQYFDKKNAFFQNQILYNSFKKKLLQCC